MRKMNLLCQIMLMTLLVSLQWTIGETTAEGQRNKLQQREKIIDRDLSFLIDARIINRITGMVVGDLTHKDFIISENGIKQTMTSLERGSTPFSLLILIDNSSFIHTQTEALTSALVGSLGDKDEAGVMVISEHPILIQKFTSDKQVIGATFKKIPQHRNVSNLQKRKAIPKALEEATKILKSAQTDRRMIVLLTDLPKAIAENVVLPEEIVRNIVKSAYGFHWCNSEPIIPRTADSETISFDKVNLTKLVNLTGGDIIKGDWKSFLDQVREIYRVGYIVNTYGRNGELVRIELELTPTARKGREDLILIYRRTAIIPAAR